MIWLQLGKIQLAGESAVPQSVMYIIYIYFKIFNRWRHILFWKSQFNNPNPNPNPKPNPKPNLNPKPNPNPNPNGMFEIWQFLRHPF